MELDAFGLIIHTTPSPDETFNFKGTVFVTDMRWLDLEPPDFSELPQGADDIQGMVAGLAAKGISSLEGQANFTAFMPEAFFAFGRKNGVDVTGADCLGYRAFVELTGSDEGFFKLNEPDDTPFADSNFDIDGEGQPDEMWRFRITNSTWSRQVLQFGQVGEQEALSGDVNQDGEITSADAILTLRFAVGLEEPTSDQRLAADVNMDGEINSKDAILILRKAAGLIDVF